MQNDFPQEPVKKRSSAGLVAAAAVSVLLVCVLAGILIFANRPYIKIEKAMEQEDIETVIRLYPKLTKDAEQDYVQDQMFKYAKILRNRFRLEKAEYDDVEVLLAGLGEQILKDYPGFWALCDEVDALEVSRSAYQTAEEAYRAGDYETALAQYELVVPEDSDYADAYARMQEIKEILSQDVEGVWAAEIELGAYMADELGVSGSLDFSFPVDMIYELKADGTGSCYLDEKSIYANEENLKKIMMDYIYSYYGSSLGMSRDELDRYFYAYYGSSVQAMVEDEVDLQEYLDYFASCIETVEFQYEIASDALVIQSGSGEGNRFYYEMPDADTLVLTGTDSANVRDDVLSLLNQYNIEYPLTFVRE